MDKDLLKAFSGVNSDFKIQLIETPFKGIVIDDFFIKPYHEKLSIYFNFLFHKNGELGPKYILEDKDFDDKNNPFNFFKLPLWKSFVSKAFDADLNKYLYFEAKCLKGPDIAKKPATGYYLSSAYNEEDKEIQVVGRQDEYKDDTENLATEKIIPTVGMVFFIKTTPHLSLNTNGGLGLHSGALKEDLFIDIEPKDNRIFLFEINPKSYRSFLKSTSSKNIFIQNFHSNPTTFLNKNLDLIIEEKINKKLPIFDRWSGNTAPQWDIEKSEEYKELFASFKTNDLIKYKTLKDTQLKSSAKKKNECILTSEKIIGPYKTLIQEKHKNYLLNLADQYLDPKNQNNSFITLEDFNLEQDFKEFIIQKINDYGKLLDISPYYQKSDPEANCESATNAYVRGIKIKEHEHILAFKSLSILRDGDIAPLKFNWTGLGNCKLLCVIYLDVEDGSEGKFYTMYSNPIKFDSKYINDDLPKSNFGEWIYFTLENKITINKHDVFIYPGCFLHEILGKNIDQKNRLIICIGLD